MDPQGAGAALVDPVDATAVARDLRAALDQAEAFVQAMPAGVEGLLFLKDGQPRQPDPADLLGYTEHESRRGSRWPSSPETGSAMLR